MKGIGNRLYHRFNDADAQGYPPVTRQDVSDRYRDRQVHHRVTCCLFDLSGHRNALSFAVSCIL